jgi:hypothetical protein
MRGIRKWGKRGTSEKRRDRKNNGKLKVQREN